MITIKRELLEEMLNTAKNVKSEIIIIPRILTAETHILGMDDYSIGKILYCDNKINTVYWEDIFLHYIALKSKDILNLNKMIKQYKVPPDEFIININRYTINNSIIDVANSIIANIQDENGITAILPLIPYQFYIKQFNILLKQSKYINKIDLNENEKFNEIANARSNIGSPMFIIPIDGEYCINLSPSLINMNNGDIVSIEIYSYDRFNIYKLKLIVKKPKKKIRIETYFLVKKIPKII